MHNSLHKLQLTNYRNLSKDIIDFSPGINCIFGQNGNGKTNILEAIYFLINKKSFRKNTSFPQIISMDCEQPQLILSSSYFIENELRTYSGKIGNDQQEWYQSNIRVKKFDDLSCEFVNPFDSFHFHNTPSFRRSWVDSHIGQLDGYYKKVLNKYQQLLKQRNTLLSKRPLHFKEQVRALDEIMAEYSFNLLLKRRDFCESIKSYCGKTFKLIFSEEHELILDISSRFDGLSQEQIREYFNQSLEKDIAQYGTSYGIHRDDYTFFFDGLNSFDYCSLGQQKMSFLSLVFAYIELFRYKHKTYPIVLIDDVSGELDGNRWRNLIDFLKEKKFQVFITTANEKFRDELEKIEDANKIYVDNGKVLHLQ